MKRKMFHLLILLLLYSGLAAQTKSLLWEISGNNIKKPSYLFGTIHTIPKKDFFFTAIMKDCFDKCKALVTEIPLDLPLSEQLNMANRTYMPNKQSIKTYISPKQYRQLYNYLSDTLRFKDAKIQRLFMFKPMFLQAYINLKQVNKHVEYETKLLKMAKKNNIKLQSLETIAFQMDIIDNIPIEHQISSLFADGENFYGVLMEQEFLKIVDLYKEQNIYQINKLMDNDPDFKQYKKLLLTDRNKAWIPKIEQFIQHTPSFIAVGAGHLPGNDGVIQLLKNKGYSLKAVSQKK